MVLAQSGIIPAPDVEGMLAGRPGPEPTAATVPGTGHDLYLERLDVLLRLLADFLAG
ncbi:hypothetical protein ACIRS1_25855 [Kitasatospora sp. NPDC101176]|uniref:hypothetical protein n=1 Tax=Kitasatospora sp. NPDC101176 TaxID=3364099 RepID=UPI00382CBC6E